MVRSSGVMAGCLGALHTKATKLFSRWQHRHDFPAAKWTNILGQTLARCVALRKQVEREVLELHVEAAVYLQNGLLDRADDKVALAIRKHKMYLAYLLIQEYCEQAINHLSEIEVCEKKECSLEAREAISSLLYVIPRCEELVELPQLEPLISSKFGKAFVLEVAEHSILCAVDRKIMFVLSASISTWSERKKMLEKIAADFEVNWRSNSRQSNAKCEHKGSTPTSSGKISGKDCTSASSSSRRSSVKDASPPSSLRNSNEVKLLHPSKSENGSNRKDNTANREVGGLQSATQNASNASLVTQSYNKIYVSSDDLDIDDEEGGARNKLCRRPSQLPDFEEVKARLMILQKKKQHTQ